MGMVKKFIKEGLYGKKGGNRGNNKKLSHTTQQQVDNVDRIASIPKHARLPRNPKDAKYPLVRWSGRDGSNNSK